MLSPAMATMLAVLTTDAAVDAGTCCSRRWRSRERDLRLPQRRRLPLHQRHRDRARQRPRGRGRRVRAHRPRSPSVCGSLAEQMARDAEGATKLVRVRVSARTQAEARVAARAVANSQLVQCSLNGGDAYWGRVLSELGASGAFIDPERVDISYNGVTVCRDGIARARRSRARNAHGRPRDRVCCDLRRARRGDGAHHRPLARLHRREPAHVMTDRRRADEST